MQSFTKYLLIFVVFWIVALSAGYFVLEYGLKDKIKAELINKISASVKESDPKAKLDIGDINFSFLEILKLKPTLELKDLNYSDLYFAESLRLKLNLAALIKKEIDIKELKVNNATVTVVNPDQTSFKIPDIFLVLKNFSSSEKAELKVTTKFFKSRDSEFLFTGEIGPLGGLDEVLSMKSFPINGELKTELFIRDIPAQLRKEYFANALLAPSYADRLKLEMKISGDIAKNIEAQGKMDINSLRLGKSEKRYIDSSASSPVMMNISLLEKQKAYTKLAPLSLKLKTHKPNAAGAMMEGEFISENVFTTDLVTGITYGSSTGHAENVEINELLSSFAPIEDFISGNFELTNYQAEFSGIDAITMMQSLTANGSLNITEAESPLIDKLLSFKKILLGNNPYEQAKSYAKAVDSSVTDENEAAVSGSQSKGSQLGCNFKIRDAVLYTSPILVETPAGQLYGSGNIKFKKVLLGKSQSMPLDFDLQLEIDSLPKLPLKVTGTSVKPAIKPDVQAITRETSTKLINTFMQNRFQQQGSMTGTPAQLLNNLLGL